MNRYLHLLLLLTVCGCTFESGSLIHPVDDIGGRCVQLGMRFTPTFDGIIGLPGGQPGQPITKEDCEYYAGEFNINWIATRMEPPSPQSFIISLNSPEYVEIEYEAGVPYCIYKRSIHHEFMPEHGFGTWQFTHNAGGWSVTCPSLEIETDQCASSLTGTSDSWASYSTVSRSECTQQIIGVDIFPEPTFP